MGRYDEALADFNRALSSTPTTPGSSAAAGMPTRRWTATTTPWPTSTAPCSSPGDAWTTGSRGQAYQAMGRYDEALADFDRALQLDPDDTWIIRSRAHAYEAMDRHDDARTDFNRAVQLDPDMTSVIDVYPASEADGDPSGPDAAGEEGPALPRPPR